jgi:hypothetical protein
MTVVTVDWMCFGLCPWRRDRRTKRSADQRGIAFALVAQSPVHLERWVPWYIRSNSWRLSAGFTGRCGCERGRIDTRLAGRGIICDQPIDRRGWSVVLTWLLMPSFTVVVMRHGHRVRITQFARAGE